MKNIKSYQINLETINQGEEKFKLEECAANTCQKNNADKSMLVHIQYL